MAFGGSAPASALSLSRPVRNTSRGCIPMRTRHLVHNAQYAGPNIVNLNISVQPFGLQGSACLTNSTDLRGSECIANDEYRRGNCEVERSPTPSVHFLGLRSPMGNRSVRYSSSRTGPVSRHESLAVSNTANLGVGGCQRQLSESEASSNQEHIGPQHLEEGKKQAEATNLRVRMHLRQRSPMPTFRRRLPSSAGTRIEGNNGDTSTPVLQGWPDDQEGTSSKYESPPCTSIETPVLPSEAAQNTEIFNSPNSESKGGDCRDKANIVSTGSSVKFCLSPRRLRLRETMPRHSVRNAERGTLSRNSSRNEERDLFSRSSSQNEDRRAFPSSRSSSQYGDRGTFSRCSSRNGEREALSRCSSRYEERRTLSRHSSRSGDIGEERRAKSAMERRVTDQLSSGAGRVGSKSASVRGRTKPDSAASRTRSSPKAKDKSSATDQAPLGERQVTWFMSLWQQCVRNNTLDKMCAIMKRLPLHQRRQLANHKHDDNSMLFTCCQMGNVDMVLYLLEDCGADIEQLGVYKVSGDGTSHMVSPLWCASVADHVDVVECLLQHGANINHPSDTGSTPVRSACFMTNIEVVQKLVEAGADIHRPNINGGTCLINSVQSVELCTFLIKHGARVNDRDNSGNLALHYAIREDRLDTVQLLIQHGSDYNARNDSSDTALQTAALRGYEDIVDYLIEHTASKLVDAIHAYELLGAHCVDERHDIAAGMAFWRRAMSLRLMNPKAPILKTVQRERKEAYSNRLEATTVEELEEVGSDPDKVYLEALLLRERILGTAHKDTTFGIMYRGAIYADNHSFQRCMDLWKYAYRLRFTQLEDPLCSELIFTVMAMVRLMWEVREDFMEYVGEDAVRFEDTLDTLHMLVTHVERAQKVLKGEVVVNAKQYKDTDTGCSCDTPPQPAENFLYLMYLSIHLCHLMLVKLTTDYTQLHRFHCLVYRLLKLDPRTRDNETLLHVALSAGLLDLIRGAGIPPPCVINLFLECGADVEAVTSEGETPLSYCLKSGFDIARTKRWEKEDYLNVLMRHGAHVDRADSMGRSCLRELQNLDNFCPLNHLTLQCLTAQVIRQNYAALEGSVEELSAPLVAFIKMH